MNSIGDHPSAPNPAEDWIYREQCGCSVRFTGESLHREMEVCVCHAHDGLKLIDKAKEKYEQDKMFGDRR